MQTTCISTIASLHLLGWSIVDSMFTILLILLRGCSTDRNDDDTRANNSAHKRRSGWDVLNGQARRLFVKRSALAEGVE